jgi:polyhydroxyalkanoate synthesis repressor PhaR
MRLGAPCRCGSACGNPEAGEKSMNRLIKRYGNRKLYDTRASRYITLDAVADLVRQGEDLRIIDNATGEDITAITFAQIILEGEKRKNGVVGLPVLRRLIQAGGEAVHEILSSVDRGREALGQLAEKGMRQLAQSAGVHDGERHGEGPRSLIDEILEVPQKQLEQIQHRIDAQVRASIERLTAHPAIRTELSRIEKNIRSLERQLHRLRSRQAPSSRGERKAPPHRKPSAAPDGE